MKTIEQIKQEFTAATGRTLPIFTFNGELGVIMKIKDEKCHAWIEDFVPFKKLDTDNIDFDAIRGLTAESDYAEEGEEITDEPIVNEENEQRLIVDGVWSTVSYNKSDKYVRELLITTDKYYNWTSERRRMIDSIWQSKKDGRFNEQRPELEKQWEEIVSQYSDPCGLEEFNSRKSSFDDLVEEVDGDYQYL